MNAGKFEPAEECGISEAQCITDSRGECLLYEDPYNEDGPCSWCGKEGYERVRPPRAGMGEEPLRRDLAHPPIHPVPGKEDDEPRVYGDLWVTGPSLVELDAGET